MARSAALFDELISGRSESHQAELRYCHRDGEVLWAQHTAALERDADGRPAFVVAMIEDITLRKRTEQELLRQSELAHQQSRHDALTGLPNRVRFAECVDQAIRSARRRKERIAVLMLDLDRFKEVNDSLGHQAGDALLQEVAQRIRRAVRDSDAVARLGGDEFGVLLTEVATEAGIVTVIDRITRAHEAADRRAGDVAGRRGVDRRRALPGARRRHGDAVAQRRRRHVRRQAAEPAPRLL